VTDHRARDILRKYDHPDNRTSPPVVIWKCTDKKRRHLVLRVFLDRGEWLVVRESFRIPMPDWLELAGAPFTVEDVREGKVSVSNARRVTPEDKRLPLDIDAWPSGDTFDAGCKCGGVVKVDIATLADDCRRARDTRIPVVGVVR